MMESMGDPSPRDYHVVLKLLHYSTLCLGNEYWASQRKDYIIVTESV